VSGNGKEHDDLQIDIERFGPGPEVIDEVSRAVLGHPSVQEQLGEARHRLLSVQLLEPALEGKPDGPLPPDRYRATIYDYTNNRVVLVTGRLEDVRGSTEVSEAGHQPLPNSEEFDEAVEVLLEDDDLGPAIREQRLVPYRPMPPLVEAELPDGRVERTLAVGLLSQGDEARHEIVGANMVNRTVSRFDNRAPERALAAAATCGLPNAHQAPTPRGLAGRFRVTIPGADGSPLWSFLVTVVSSCSSKPTRRSSMSGTTGMPAAPSATGFSRRAGSRRMGRTSPRESDAHNRPHRPSSSQVRTQGTFGASRYTARDKR
jgi:hypothetical protein